MKRAPATESSRKPPAPSESHADIDDWMRRVMPDLHPVVVRLDEMIRAAHPGLQFAVKWKKAHYGLPELGWIIEMVAYDVSVNLVFYAGSEFDPPPPDGSGRARYVKVRSVAEVERAEIQKWIELAGRQPGWKAANA